MRSWKENQLSYLFPFMRKEYSTKNGKRVVKSIACECDDGWFNILFDLCRDISLIFDNYDVKPFIRIIQIKEKYGTLRVYWGLDFPDHFKPEDRVNINNQIEATIDNYETKSSTTCECCGNPGSKSTINNWVVTRCKECKSADVIYYTSDTSQDQADWVVKMVNILKNKVEHTHIWEIIRDIAYCLHDTPDVIYYDDEKAIAAILTHIKYLQKIKC